MKLLLKKCMILFCSLSIIVGLAMPLNAYAKQVESQNEENKLIQITPYTNIEELPGVQPDSDIYNDLIELQKEQIKQSLRRNILPNWVYTRPLMYNSTTVRIQIQNRAIDTLDSVIINFSSYDTSGNPIISARRVEYSILPMTWRNNNFYVGTKYKKSTITIVARDGNEMGTTVYYHYK